MPQKPGDHGVSTRDRLEWLGAVRRAVEAGTLTCTAFALAYVIAFIYLNGKSGVAWPSQDTLGQRLGLGARQVRSLLQTLEGADFITRTPLGARRPDEIRLRLDMVKPASTATAEAKYRSWLGNDDRK